MKTKPVRIRKDDWVWLMHNRGSGSVPDKVHELVEMAKEAYVYANRYDSWAEKYRNEHMNNTDDSATPSHASGEGDQVTTDSDNATP